MAKYTIDHECGHSVTVDLRGKNSDRIRTIAWLEGQSCEECKIAELKLATATRAAAIRDGGLDQDWVALTGSPKQIEWATTIRFRLLSDAIQLATEAESLVLDQGKDEAGYADLEQFAKLKAAFPLLRNYPDARIAIGQHLEEIGSAVAHLRSIPSAGFWIDSRSTESGWDLILTTHKSIKDSKK